ncbi:uncharacterized protein LOC114250508 [Bombyx mandarina]|uniref:Uncharacterized protein LOC114250508 n=1 Tax=Bombyx mandarina TaxID=7092 RepID=A0A6J2KH09_BOMMA|nr:uncharacterized protein LOC114250508 [Bombyx mandarina]
MLRIVSVLAVVAVVSASPKPGIDVFQIDIEPEEAQKYLNSPPFTDPQLAGRTAVLPLIKYNDPRFRTVEAGPTLGHYWKNGKEIENTEDYVEEVYDASQYHGQDGLGAYAYGYQTPESAKVENRVRSGDVTGSYIYKDGKNDLVKVRYWSDRDGFHQEDNLPKVELKPVEEAPDVRAARIAHEKAWQEAAAAAAQQPDPQYALKALPKDYYQQTYKALPSDYYQPQASEQQASVVAPPNSQPREGKAYQSQGSYVPNQGSYNQGQGDYGQNLGSYGPNQGNYGPNQGSYGQNDGSYNQNQGSYQPGQGFTGKPLNEKYEEPEPTGPPRGFFYSFTYPVSSIVLKSDLQGGSAPTRYPADKDTISVGGYNS